LKILDTLPIVKRDVSLGVRVLRCINSAAYEMHQEIHSVRQGLVLLGVEQLRKWASIWALAGLNGSGTPEVAVMSIVRAQCCELIGQAVFDVAIGAEFFLLGLCSLLDVLLCQPMPTVLAALPLPAEIHDALIGTPNAAWLVLNAVIAYERGAWDEAVDIGQKIGVSASVLSTAYASALQWAQTTSELLQRAP
jgi:EAL and modified HD-GYP domain-containing signal transduction protein